MSRKRGDQAHLADIQDAARQIREYVKESNFEKFVNDRKTQDAVVRNLEIMGEATKQISASLRKRHPEVPWKSIAGVRDRLIHGYFEVSLETVWKIASEELPVLESNLLKILDE